MWRQLGEPTAGLCGCVCGVGGAKVAEMIPTMPDEITTLVLQPNLHHHLVRQALHKAGWTLTDEQLTLDHRRLFLTLRAVRVGDAKPEVPETTWPEQSLSLSADPLYPLWLWVYLEKERYLLNVLPASSSERIAEKRARHQARENAILCDLKSFFKIET